MKTFLFKIYNIKIKYRCIKNVNYLLRILIHNILFMHIIIVHTTIIYLLYLFLSISIKIFVFIF